MKSYLNLLAEVYTEGVWQSNRTGIDCKFIPGGLIKHDMSLGHPVLTTRKAPWKGATAEMIGFLNGLTNAAEFRELGCPFWTKNANETKDWLQSPFRKGEDDMGEVYGHFWRNWKTDDGQVIDQVRDAIEQLCCASSDHKRRAA